MSGEPDIRHVVIRAQPERKPGGPAEAFTKDPQRSEAGSLPLALAVLGGLLACFGPLLPWWEETAGRILLLRPERIIGVTTWPGIVAELAGACAVILCAYSLTKPEARPALAILAAGAIALLAAGLGLVAPSSGVGSTLDATAQPGLYVTLFGGLATTIGGYMQTREGQEP